MPNHMIAKNKATFNLRIIALFSIILAYCVLYLYSLGKDTKNIDGAS